MTQIERREDPDKQLSDRTRDMLHRGISANTRDAYGRELKRYRQWCEAHGRITVPATPETLTEYVSALTLAGLAPSSIRRAMAAVRTAHRASNTEPPDATGALTVLRAYAKDIATGAETVNTHQAPALLLPDLRKIVAACDPASPAGVRDRALIVLGWAMMARRSELAGLNVTDVTDSVIGLDVTVRMSKTDQDALGARVGVPYGSHPETCPVRLTKAWIGLLASQGQTSGPLFRPIDRYGHLGGTDAFAGRANTPRMTPQAVEVVLRRAALRAGLDPKFTPHSLRSGGATQAYQAGADLLKIARHGRWQPGSKVLLGYIRTTRIEDNPMDGIGL